MNTKDTSITIKISKELKNNAQNVLNSIEMTMSEAITVFLTQLVNDNGLPFRPQCKNYGKIRQEKDNNDTDTLLLEELFKDDNSTDD